MSIVITLGQSKLASWLMPLTLSAVNWIATDDRAQEIIDFLVNYSPEDEGFFPAVKKGINTYWPKPTPNMRNAMVKVLDKRAAQAAEWATRDGKCEFVGTVGEQSGFRSYSEAYRGSGRHLWHITPSHLP